MVILRKDHVTRIIADLVCPESYTLVLLNVQNTEHIRPSLIVWDHMTFKGDLLIFRPLKLSWKFTRLLFFIKVLQDRLLVHRDPLPGAHTWVVFWYCGFGGVLREFKLVALVVNAKSSSFKVPDLLRLSEIIKNLSKLWLLFVVNYRVVEVYFSLPRGLVLIIFHFRNHIYVWIVAYI
jgi:hypothetical protein